MKKLPQYLMPVSDHNADSLFDVVVRDAHSAVLFWDMNGSVPFEECNQRTSLAVRVRTASQSPECETSDPQILPLQDFAGHLLLPLKDSSRIFDIELGWLDRDKNFSTLSSERITLPDAPAHLSPRVDPRSGLAILPMRHARYAHLVGSSEPHRVDPSLAS